MPENNQDMTKDEFRAFVDANLWEWLSDRSRSLEAHLLGLEEWVHLEYNKAVTLAKKKSTTTVDK